MTTFCEHCGTGLECQICGRGTTPGSKIYQIAERAIDRLIALTHTATHKRHYSQSSQLRELLSQDIAKLKARIAKIDERFLSILEIEGV